MDDLRLPAKKTDEPISTAPQWIPLSGPGSRLPTTEDADEFGGVYVCSPSGAISRVDWGRSKEIRNVTHWCPIQKAPPLPKPVEPSQEERDFAKARELYESRYSPKTNIVDGIRYGRADGRKQLAQEALGLIEDNYSLSDIEHLSMIRALHELLMEAAR